MTAPVQTSWLVGEKSASKPLGKFGSKSVCKPVSQGIAKANADDLSDLPSILLELR